MPCCPGAIAAASQEVPTPCFDKAISGYFGPIPVQLLNPQLFDNESFVFIFSSLILLRLN